MHATTSEYAILGMLTIRPMTGYSLKQEIAGSIAHFWNESYGQIYPSLKRLEAAALVKRLPSGAGARANRQVYSITPKGERELQRWLAQAPRPQPVRQEMLLKVFFSAKQRPTALASMLEKVRSTAVGDVERFRELEEQVERDNPRAAGLQYWRFTLNYGRHMALARSRWAAETLTTLKKMKKAKPQ